MDRLVDTIFYVNPLWYSESQFSEKGKMRINKTPSQCLPLEVSTMTYWSAKGLGYKENFVVAVALLWFISRQFLYADELNLTVMSFLKFGLRLILI